MKYGCGRTHTPYDVQPIYIDVFATSKIFPQCLGRPFKVFVIYVTPNNLDFLGFSATMSSKAWTWMKAQKEESFKVMAR